MCCFELHTSGVRYPRELKHNSRTSLELRRREATHVRTCFELGEVLRRCQQLCTREGTTFILHPSAIMPTIKVGPGSDLDLQQIADALGKSKKVVVVTGAGISTNCGIPVSRPLKLRLARFPMLICAGLSIREWTLFIDPSTI